MSNFKSFSGVKVEVSEDIGFELEGHSFPCLPQPPASVYRHIADPMWAAPMVIEFIEGCIGTDASLAVFKSLIASKEIIIPLEVLRDIVIYLVEEYANRPFFAHTPASSGQQDRENGSTGTASQEVLTLLPSPSTDS